MRKDLAKIIDHTLLRPGVTKDELRTHCKEASEFKFAAVCINSANVAFCAQELSGTRVKVVAAVGFPMGDVSDAAKVTETHAAVVDGAEEIDMVLRLGALRSGDVETVRRDIRAVVQAAQGCPVKVILETALLNEQQKRVGAEAAIEAGAAFLKTSTGFVKGGATVQDVALLCSMGKRAVGVKASGGIRDMATADAMVAAGATRLGTSASIEIVTGGMTAKEVVY